MKRIMYPLSILLLLGGFLTLANCSSDNGDDNNSGGTSSDGGDGSSSSVETGSGVSFESFTPRSILVKNNTNKNLVAFKGALNPNYLISGIPAFATNHGLKKEGIFTGTGDFALIFVTEEAYIANKTNIAAAPIFATIYAFYNNEADNNNVFEISSKAGGDGRITLQNRSIWNVEIRKDGAHGEVLGYAAAEQLETTLRVEAPSNYNLFPVFRKYSKSDGEIYTVVPTFSDGPRKGTAYSRGFGVSQSELLHDWDLADIAGMLNFNWSSGGFYIRIQNDAGQSIRLVKGTEEQITSTGLSLVNVTKSNVYQIKIPANPDGTFPATTIASGYKIGPMGAEVPIPEHEYKTDYVYTIRITGLQGISGQTIIGTIVESAEPIDLEAKFNMP